VRAVSADDPRQSLQRKTDEFLREFFEKGEMLVKELITENDRLRSQLETKSSPTETESKPVTRDNMVDLLMLRISALERECDEIRKIAGNVEEESGGFRYRLDSLESEHYHLASMFVAGSQFHSATSFDEVLRTITEILLNFVGAGSFTVYLVDEERQVLFPVAREGGLVEERPEIALTGDAGPAQAALISLGRPWKNGDPEFQIGDELINLPLVSGSRLVGVARLESFLEQKHGFADNDHQLLGLISEHAGIGIENAWIRAHTKDVPLQRQAIEHLVGA
jgi:hypothetical protein